MELGYARLSTTRQDLDRQLDELVKHGIPAERIYCDKKTGATQVRSGFADLLACARAGDTIVVTNLDRLGFNLRECLNIVCEQRERGVGIKTLADPILIDSSGNSAVGEQAVALLALFAQMELVFSRERAAHARSIAVSEGKMSGRPRKLADDALAAARASVEAGMSVDQVASLFRVSRATLYRHLNTPGTVE